MYYLAYQPNVAIMIPRPAFLWFQIKILSICIVCNYIAFADPRVREPKVYTVISSVLVSGYNNEVL